MFLLLVISRGVWASPKPRQQLLLCAFLWKALPAGVDQQLTATGSEILHD